MHTASSHDTTPPHNRFIAAVRTRMFLIITEFQPVHIGTSNQWNMFYTLKIFSLRLNAEYRGKLSMPLVRVLVIEIILKFNNFYAILKQFFFSLFFRKFIFANFNLFVPRYKIFYFKIS